MSLPSVRTAESRSKTVQVRPAEGLGAHAGGQCANADTRLRERAGESQNLAEFGKQHIPHEATRAIRVIPKRRKWQRQTREGQYRGAIMHVAPAKRTKVPAPP